MTSKMIGIIGGGSWATAIVKILQEDKTREIGWWVRSADTRDGLTKNGRNPRHLSSVRLDSSRLHITNDLNELLQSHDILLLAVPSAYLHSVLSMVPAEAYAGKRVISAVKGTIPDCCTSVSHYLENDLGIDRNDICVVSGPSHAEEVAAEMPTFVTMASHNTAFANEVADLFRCNYCHTSATDDIDGIEHCVLAKNIYAIAAGICQGLGYGDNLNAVLTSAALHEIGAQLAKYLPHEGRRIEDYSYLGDLMVTCWSGHSRNRALGLAVATGKRPQTVFARTGSVAEGYYSVKNMHTIYERLGDSNSIPIAEAVYRILYEGANARKEMEYLINNVF